MNGVTDHWARSNEDSQTRRLRAERKLCGERGPGLQPASILHRSSSGHGAMRLGSAGYRAACVSALLLLGCAGASQPAAAPAPVAKPASMAMPTVEPSSAPAPSRTDGVAAGTPATPAAQEKPMMGTPRERLMRSHFKETEVVRAAVVRGTLSDAVAPAEALSRMDALGEIQPGWEAPLAALQKASLRMSQSPDIPGASAAMADIGVACGSCHRIAGGPKVKPTQPPVMSNTLASRMQRHAWATDRLWEGLYVPADASWKIGGDALVDDPFPKELLDKGGVYARSAAARFRSLAATIGSQKKLDERAKLYSSLLETCSACHMAVRNQP